MGGDNSIPHARLTGTYAIGERYPAAMINVTNRCNLQCEHCFIYRDGNPNLAPERVRDEISEEVVLDTLVKLRDKYGIAQMLWMGGEPLLRRSLVARGIPLFARNTITTNGTVALTDFGPEVLYVVSLDGPRELNDVVRGAGVFDRVKRNLARIPADFESKVQVQCVVTRRNQDHLEPLVRELRETRVGWMTFSFYSPPANDTTGLGWSSLEDRMHAVQEVTRLKDAFPGFVRNRVRSLELMSPDRAPDVTGNCPAKRFVLPLYLEDDSFVTPFCCYGNDVDCDACGAWVVFDLAALEER